MNLRIVKSLLEPSRKKYYSRDVRQTTAKNHRKTAAKGFTLIELMVAISIVAILATVGLVQYGSAQKIARDSKRKQDLRSIATALELYRQTNGRYPCTPDEGFFSHVEPSTWLKDNNSSCNPSKSFDNAYINMLPTDPKNNNAIVNGSGAYSYMYWAGGTAGGNCPTTRGRYYYLATRLENPNDMDSNSKRSYKSCNGNSAAPGGTYFTSGWPGDLFIITSQ